MENLNIITHKTISLEEREVQYKLIISQKARRLSLKIGPQSGLEVVVPRRVQLSTVPRFIHSKQNWVLKHLREIERKKREARKNAFRDGAAVHILGQQKEVNFLKTDKKNHYVKEVKILKIGRDEAYFAVHKIFIYLNRKKIRGLTERALSKEARVALEKHLKARARRHFLRRTAELAEIMGGLTYNRITIKNHRARWGSCSRDKNLNFNWRLIMTTPDIIDSIIIHELGHLQHLNHSKRFYAFIEQFCPDHRRLLRELGQIAFPL